MCQEIELARVDRFANERLSVLVRRDAKRRRRERSNRRIRGGDRHEFEHRRANPQLVAGVEIRRGDSLLIDKSAVGRLQIRHDTAVFTSVQRAVAPRNGFVVDLHVTALKPSERETLPRRERDRTAALASRADDQLEAHVEMIGQPALVRQWAVARPGGEIHWRACRVQRCGAAIQRQSNSSAAQPVSCGTASNRYIGVTTTGFNRSPICGLMWSPVISITCVT